VPLYEYHCPSCELTFEALAPMRTAQRSKACRRCGRRAPRVTSAFSISHAGPGGGEGTAAPIESKPASPLCLRYPQMPLLCHMDQRSAERFVAHVQGRGAQYDDAVEAHEELRKKRGEAPPVVAKTAADEHGHAHPHGRSHKGKKGHAHSHRHRHHHVH
jgi:putative FmdB family regulatory protein